MCWLNLVHHFQLVMATLIFFLQLSLFLSSFSRLSCSISDTLHKASSLSVEKPSDLLVSPNEIFSAGFHAVGLNAYSFAIWFTKPSHVHNRTIVWMANRDQPINGRLSKLSLLRTGNLILTDAGQSISWATNTVSTSSSLQLKLYNSGNLVLRTPEGVVFWQSFDSPTDTLLPEQPLTRYTKLISSRSQTNCASGFYKLFFDDDNVLRMIFDGPETSSIFWPDPWLLSNQANRSRYNDTRNAVFDSRGHFKSSDRVEFQATDFGKGPQRRLTLDSDGNLRLYSLEEPSGTWVVSWQAISKTCRIHGACGPNSLCTYDPSVGRKCSCLPRFKMINHTDLSYGCEPEFNLSCKHHEAAFIKLPQADFYGYNLYIWRNYSLKMCKNRCLELCNCRGLHYRFNYETGVYDCYPKREFRNGHGNFGGVLYFKAPKDLVSDNEPLEEFRLGCSNDDTKQLDRAYKREGEIWQLRFFLWFTGGFGLFEIVCILLVWCCLYRTRQRSHAAMEGYLPAATGFRKFTFSELKKVTRGFSEEIGRGVCGVVYKGILSDSRVAAIKRLNEANQGEEDFLAELSTIGRLNHMNLTEMWGYCAERKHRLLVYEYMENGSLAENLQSNTLDWEKRFNIAVGTAKGLAYLHEECLEWVLHCDVKPHNILLDTNFLPKVSDFGLSKILNRGGENNPSFSRIRGTRGYMAPEWVFNLPITSKVDVYSFGIVVLEMVTGKSAITSVNAIGNEGEMKQRRLVKWVREKRSRGALMTSLIKEIIDPMMNGNYDMDKMEILVGVALHCVEEDKDARPTMSQVIEMLLHHPK
ncbi:putative receptor protein kinase ZmPK1 [Cornus florida]|uniref:putative receptor protein kinase ZmPK1 n=1 Tax=Cornus florida TaxID=4283 RepID=UPI00289F7231|nr:putative receptor protein kinase ZmPK1 [Cornus florida]